MSTPLEDRLATLVVGRAYVRARRPERADAIAAATYRFAAPTDTRAAWQARIAGAFATLETAGTLDAKGRLADRDELARRIGGFRVRDWQALTTRALPALALGIAPAVAAKLKDGREWLGVIAARALDIGPAGAAPSLSAVGDALVWRGLGLAGKPKRCPGEVRAAVLRRALPAEVTATTYEALVRLHAAQALGSPRPDLGGLLDALVRRWLAGVRFERATPSPAPPASADDAAFVAAVDALVRDRSLPRFGDRKLYIAAAHAALPAYAHLSLDAFKQRLLAAHHAGHLELARGDVLAAMDPALVAASETHADGARFHFIVKDPA